MGILRSDLDLVFFHGLLVKPQETSFIHVGEEHGFIFIWYVLPVRVMLPILAESMRVLAFPVVAAEIEADARAVLEFSLVWEGFGDRSTFLDMEDAHLQRFIGGLPPLLWLSIVAIGLALTTFVSCRSRRFRVLVLLCGSYRWGHSGDVAALLDKEGPSKWGDILRYGTVFDVLGHLLEKFRDEFDRDGNLLDVEGAVVDFDLVRIDRVLGKGSKMLEALMKFSH